jgi:hypothetical protein
MKFDEIWSNGKEVRARMLEKENGNEQFPGLCGSYADAAVKEGSAGPRGGQIGANHAAAST